MENITDEKLAYLFGMFFLIEKKLEYLGNKELKESGITTKQWMVLAVIHRFFESPPSLKEVAEKMNTSHQNVKQLANQLQIKRFLDIERDPEDHRILRLKLTEENTIFWKKREDRDREFISQMFSVLTKQETRELYTTINKIINNIDNLLLEDNIKKS
ncbi:MAG: MarR family winged helix-turn-helix transcriptional regulator [Candidatus Methanofastidiosia archaeon]